MFLSAIPGRNRRFKGYKVGPGYEAEPAPSSQIEEQEDIPPPPPPPPAVEEQEDIPPPPPPAVEDLPGTSHTGVTEVEPDHPDPGVTQRMSTINKFLDTLESQSYYRNAISNFKWKKYNQSIQ